MSDPRLSRHGLRVLRMFVEVSADALAGSDITLSLGIGSSTVYPLLARLLKAGWLSAKWEKESGAAGRPRKKFYKLTALGRKKAQEALAELQ